MIGTLRLDYSFNNKIKMFIFSMFFNYLVMAAINNVLQGIYFKAIGLDEVFIGNLIALRTLATGFGSIPAGFIADRFGRRNSVLLGVLISAIGYLGQVLWINPIIIYFFACLNGLGIAIIIVNEAPFLVENCEEEKRINVFSVNFVITNLAFVIGSFVAGKLPEVFGLNTVGSLKITQIIFAFIAFLPLIPLSKIKERIIRCEKTAFGGYASLFKNEKIRWLMVYYIFGGFGAGLIVPFFNIFLEYKLKAGTGIVGQIMGYSQVATIIGGLMVPFVAKKFGRGFTVQLCQFLSIPFLLTISGTGGAFVISVCFFMRSALMNMASPAIQSLSMELVEDCDRSSFSSLVNLSSHIARGISASVAGIMMANISYEFPYYITSVFYVGAIFIFHKVFDSGIKGMKNKRTGDI